MRIIGGYLKGRELRSFSSSRNAFLRPTSDRVKESVFNVLTHKFQLNFYGINVLDLFAGTGSLGLEALSRGAKNATFVERDNYACSIILDNVETLRVKSKISIMKKDCLNIGENGSHPFDLVFIDPPYGQRLGEKTMENMLRGKWFRSKSLIVWEESTKIAEPKNVKRLDIRKYGETNILIAEVMV